MNSSPGDGIPSARPLATLRDVGLAAAAAALTAVVWQAGGLAAIDRATGDASLRLTNRATVEVPVAAVVIDDRSVTAFGPLPWPRALVAEVIDRIHAAGAAGVAVDILLIDAADEAGDLSLASALDAGPSLLAASLGRDGSWLLPHPRFGGAERAAHAHAEVGPDGVARVIAATKQAGSLSLPALSLAAARILRPEIPVVPGSVFRPDFRPAPHVVRQIAVADLLASPDQGELMAGRTVFVGVTATGSGDRLVVPTESEPAPSPGVLVHASAAASLLRGGLVRSPDLGWSLLGIVLAAMVPQLLRTRRGAFQAWVVATIAVAVVVGAVAALDLWHLMLPVPALLTGMIVSVVLREGVESRLAQRESGVLLESLLRHHDPDRGARVPISSVARLAAMRTLQDAVLRQDAARRTLLEGMRDGVVMWGADGRTRVVNPAAVRLWGEEPGRDDFEEPDIDVDGHANEASTVHRDGRELSVAVFPVGGGGMALLRDVTAERELERKRRDMQRLVSHELKTPLASIAGFGETLQRYELTKEEQQRVASLIRGESQRLGEMVATFLDLERLGTDQMSEPVGAVDLGALVEQRLEILSEAARSRRQHIAADIEPGITVQASTTLLARVVDNLVGNALKYSSDGDTVEVTVSSDQESAILTVTDHGPGIPEEALPRLFERFYRVPGVERSGSGLGLAVADEVVTWHGGCIKVESTVGLGSRFVVHLPVEA